MPNIYFYEIKQDALEETLEWLQERFANATTLKGTRSFHNFTPVSTSRIVTTRINFDEQYSYIFDFLQQSCETPAFINVKLRGYSAIL